MPQALCQWRGGGRMEAGSAMDGEQCSVLLPISVSVSFHMERSWMLGAQRGSARGSEVDPGAVTCGSGPWVEN